MRSELGASDFNRTIAVVSGRGGSGKTIACATLGLIATRYVRMPVVLVDCDLGTGGLSFYLGLNYKINANAGLLEFLMHKTDTVPVQKLVGFDSLYVVSVGDARTFVGETQSLDISTVAIANSIRTTVGDCLIILDCRGGVDTHTLQVCRTADEILVIAETDVSAIQTTRNLFDVLSKNDLLGKVGGFILNKAFDDPSSLAKAGNSLFGAPFVGALPFDFETIRAFTRGRLPPTNTPFYLQMESIFRSHVMNLQEPASISFERFSSIGTDKTHARGGKVVLLFLASACFYLSLMLISMQGGAKPQAVIAGYPATSVMQALVSLSSLLVVIVALSDQIQSALGRAIETYVRICAGLIGPARPRS